MYSLWKATSRALATCTSSRSSSTNSEWCGQRAQTICYLRHRGRALLEACHGRVEDLTETILEEQLERLLDVEDEAEFELRADRFAGMFAFRFAAMRLATEVLRDDMRDYKIELPDGSPCIGWDETAWQRSTAEAQGAEAYARRLVLVGSLMEDAQLTETGPPFRPGLGQGWTFARPVRYLAAAVVGSEIPIQELGVAVRNLSKACRARGMGECIADEEDDDGDEKVEAADLDEEDTGRQGVSKFWNKALVLLRKRQ